MNGLGLQPAAVKWIAKWNLAIGFSMCSVQQVTGLGFANSRHW